MGALFGVPIFGYFMATFAIAPALAITGGVAGSETLTRWSAYFTTEHKTVVFITTLVTIALVSLISFLGTRLMMRVATTLIVIAGIGFLIDMLILLFTSHSHFINSVNDLAGPDAYAKTVEAGRSWAHTRTTATPPR
jgi:amino acid transporter